MISKCSSDFNNFLLYMKYSHWHGLGHCIDSAARGTKQTSHRKIDAGTKEKNWSPGTTLHSSHIHTVQYVHHKHSIFLILYIHYGVYCIHTVRSSVFERIYSYEDYSGGTIDTSKYFIVMLVF